MTMKRMFGKTRFKVLAVYLVLALTLITVAPRQADATTIPTRASVEAAAVPGDFDRKAEIGLIMTVLKTENGQATMRDVGVTAEQMEIYLNKLSDAQLNAVSSKVKAQLPPGGDVGGIVWGVITVLVILILVFIFLDITGLYKLPFRRG